MKPTKLLIAAVLLAGLGGLIWWVNKHPQDKSDTTTKTTKLLAVPETQIQSVEVQKKGAPALTLTKDKSKWEITTPQSYSADQDAVQSIVSSLSDVSADSV